ncbi:MAG: rRNA pseudouridine synthase [Treponema sp.]|nr:rRNA pseudouridine synthase [Treponema sp.]
MSGNVERLDKVLSRHGYGSRKDTGRLIAGSRVCVNGEITRDSGFHVSLDKDRISVDGKDLEIKIHRHLMMNKKAGYVCSTKEGAHETVFDLLDGEDIHGYLGGELALVGRLDVDTEGLLLFTTDGKLNHFLTSPKNRVPKTYLVHLANAVSDEEKKAYALKLKEGIHIDADGNDEACDCLPAEIEWLSEKESGVPCSCHLTIYEGKYHEVKRMFSALGNSVAYLKRVAFNQLKLDEKLLPGQYRDLTEDELEKLKECAGNL